MLNLIRVWEMHLTTKEDETNTAHLSQNIVWRCQRKRFPTSNDKPRHHFDKRATLRMDHGTGQTSASWTPALLTCTPTAAHTLSHSCGRPRRSGSDNIYIAPLCTVLRPQQTQSESLRCSDDCHKISCHKNWFEAKERKWRHTPK